MRKSFTLSAKYVPILVGMSLTSPEIAHTQSLGDADKGLTLAKAWCSECHQVESGAYGISVADFPQIARLPSTTALSLRVFLQSSHKEMPNLNLTPSEADDIIAYILSLKPH